MSFIRTVKQENPFVQMDKRSIGGGDLSLKATGLLLYFLSKPNDWQIRLGDVEKRFKDGRDSIRSGLKELQETGYVTKYQSQDDNGKFGDWVYYVYELPQYNPAFNENTGKPIKTPKTEKPNSVKPMSEKPTSDNPSFSNNDLTNNDLTNNKDAEAEATLTVTNHYENNFGMAKPVVLDSLLQWEGDLTRELVIEAITLGAKRNAKSFTFIENILNQWANHNIQTVEQARKYEQSQPGYQKGANYGRTQTRHGAGHGAAASTNSTGQTDPLFGNGRFKPKT